MRSHWLLLVVALVFATLGTGFGTTLVSTQELEANHLVIMDLLWDESENDAEPGNRIPAGMGQVPSSQTQGTRMTSRQSSLLAGVSLLLLSPVLAGGQETAKEGPRTGGLVTVASGPESSDRTWWSLWSLSSPYDRVYLGMWTFHPFSDDPFHLETNNGVGLQYRSLFAFTCVNSFDRRTYVAGVERVWLEARRGGFAAMLGFRVGLIRGYDTELLQVAGDTPVLPFAGTVALFRLGPIGGEISWVYRAVSLVGAVFF